MPLDHYITLGHSGLRVSPMCLGTMTFGEDWGWGASEADCQRMLDRYFALGGNFVDTANLYTLGHAEKIIGDHLAQDPAQRQRTVLATKFFASMNPGDPNAGGAGRKNIMAACDASLRRLRTDYIDLYWMHCWDFHTPIEETMRALDDLVRAGKVRHIGFSDTPAWKVTQAQMMARQLGWAPLIGLQVEYSLLEESKPNELVTLRIDGGASARHASLIGRECQLCCRFSGLLAGVLQTASVPDILQDAQRAALALQHKLGWEADS